MKNSPFTLSALAILSVMIIACQPVAEAEKTSPCVDREKIGLFDPSVDLLVANYDSKPDVDDLQAVAGLGSVLKHNDFSCVDYVAVAGAYGTQTGKFLPAADLFNLAFGDRWLDAHANRGETISALTVQMRGAIEAGGKVWVAEAGQSDVTAAAVRELPEAMWAKVNVVQHSFWNESHSSPDAMQLVIYKTRYHRVADGNFPENGSPAFNTDESAHWEPLLSDARIGPIWREARRLSNLHNPVAEYVNPAVETGGLDFSDTVEIAYIFGFDEMADVGDFVERFAEPPQKAQ